MIIKSVIKKVLEDAIHISAYPSIDTVTAYFRHLLLVQVNRCKYPLYAKRFTEDRDFSNRVTPLVCPLQFPMIYRLIFSQA